MSPSMVWGEVPIPPYRSKTDLTANNHLASLEREVERLKRLNDAQAEELKAVAWMCKACGATFPSMLVLQGIDGKMICPRCSEPGKVVRAHEAMAVLMKEKLQQSTTATENQTLLKEQVELLKDKVSRAEPEKQKAIKDMTQLREQNETLKGQIVILREELRKARVRATGGRTVEGEPDA